MYDRQIAPLKKKKKKLARQVGISIPKLQMLLCYAILVKIVDWEGRKKANSILSQQGQTIWAMTNLNRVSNLFH